MAKRNKKTEEMNAEGNDMMSGDEVTEKKARMPAVSFKDKFRVFELIKSGVGDIETLKELAGERVAVMAVRTLQKEGMVRHIYAAVEDESGEGDEPVEPTTESTEEPGDGL